MSVTQLSQLSLKLRMSHLSLSLSLYVECLINISYLLVAECVRLCECLCVCLGVSHLPTSLARIYDKASSNFSPSAGFLKIIFHEKHFSFKSVFAHFNFDPPNKLWHFISSLLFLRRRGQKNCKDRTFVRNKIKSFLF